MAAAQPPGVRELRIALVCYGGVSLAIYMHGITKELHKLVLASRAFEADPARNPFDAETQTEHAYYELLARLATAGVPLRVVVDVISGTSAGGINGVYLAKALANNESQDALRELWISKGDIDRLVRGPRWLPLKARFVELLGKFLLGPTGSETPLRGDQMCRWLYDALAVMDGTRPDRDRVGGQAADSLVPPGETLDLLVTTTDLRGYERVIETGAGGVVQHDRTYRHVFHFTHDPARGKRQLDGDYNGPLAFAARCTSSFPGAFPPVSIDHFAADLEADPPPGAARRFDPATLGREFFPEYELADDDARTTFFVDGGVLDNAPFDHVIDEISRKRADNEVLRHIVYIEPDPGPQPAAGTASSSGSVAPPREDDPGWLSTIWTTRTTIPWHEPILGQLLRIRDINARIRDVADIAQRQMQAVSAILDEAASGWGANDLAFDALRQLGTQLHQQAATVAGLSYPTYCRLKLDTVTASLADQIAATYTYPPDSSQASFTRAVLSAWMQQTTAWAATRPEELADFLRRLDVAYRERRLRFVLQGLNDLYQAGGQAGGAPPRESLDAAKRTLWDALEDALAFPGRALRQLPERLHAFLDRQALSGDTVFGDPRRFADDHRDDIQALVDAYADQLKALTKDAGQGLWEQFRERTAAWSEQARLDLASRYLGFPIWDTLVFPIIALADLPQLHPIAVSRFSPLDADLLEPPADHDAHPQKLKGTRWHHFGAFFDRAWRENDYLWGRLDGAQLLLELLQASVAGDGDSGDARRRAAIAAHAVLASERALGDVPELRTGLQHQVDELLR